MNYKNYEWLSFYVQQAKLDNHVKKNYCKKKRIISTIWLQSDIKLDNFMKLLYFY